MKKLIISLMLIFAAFAVNAQTQQVTQGSTHTYSVDANADYQFNWSTDGGTSTDLSLDTDESVVIVWDGAADTYNITMYPTSTSTNCSGDNVTQAVQIVATSITWDVFTATECPVSDNNAVTPNTIEAQFTGISGDWSYTYSIDGGADVSVNVTGSATNQLTLPATLYENTSASATSTIEVRITSVTTPDGVILSYDGSEGDAANHLFTLTVQPLPTATGGITVN